MFPARGQRFCRLGHCDETAEDTSNQILRVRVLFSKRTIERRRRKKPRVIDKYCVWQVIDEPLLQSGFVQSL
jgi:hypothetical protein